MTQSSLADWTKTIQRSAMQDMLELAAQPDVISFALGLPAAELFPAQEYGAALQQVLLTDPLALQYNPPPVTIKAEIVKLMALRGLSCRQEQIFLTAGAQQGQALLARLLVNPGDVVLVEESCYPGFKQVLDTLSPKILTTPTDPQTGIDVDAVERLLQAGHRPKLLYLVPEGNNPLTVSLSPEKRQRLVTLARAYQMPILEDDPYGLLYYDHQPEPPLCARDPEWVFYIGSVSKILAPATRVGWVVVPEWLLPSLAMLKESSDINTTTLTQRAVGAYLATQHHIAHIAHLRSAYKTRRDAMIEAIAEHFPCNVQLYTPNCGVFLWVALPRGSDTGKLLKAAIQQARVAFIPGHAFNVANAVFDGVPVTNAHCMRLNFSNTSPEKIVEGIRRLGSLLEVTIKAGNSY